MIPITFGIYSSLSNLLTEIKNAEGQKLCQDLIESIKKRLFPYETRTVAKLATILDPRFKKDGFRTAENATSAATLLEQEMFSITRKISQEQSAAENTSVGEARCSPENTSSLFGFLNERLKQKAKSITADVILTKRQYLERSNSNEDVDPLLFWKVSLKLVVFKICCYFSTVLDYL